MKPSPPGAPRNVSAASQQRLSAPQRYLSVALLLLTRAVAEPRQFQQSRLSRAGSEKVKAIEHPVNFLNKTTLPIRTRPQIVVVYNWTLPVLTLSIGYSTTHSDMTTINNTKHNQTRRKKENIYYIAYQLMVEAHKSRKNFQINSKSNSDGQSNCNSTSERQSNLLFVCSILTSTNYRVVSWFSRGLVVLVWSRESSRLAALRCRYAPGGDWCRAEDGAAPLRLRPRWKLNAIRDSRASGKTTEANALNVFIPLQHVTKIIAHIATGCNIFT